ncbi:hypothetical protein [Photobacterium leiognathi]|uniref:hypothetical protein n=1 Tax=Photobacterium leiognathi TaxID=553611 RepID=UPI0029810DEB|nr:hypothetical protein [Photobacterium leiognathi]
MNVEFAAFGTAPKYKAMGFKGVVELTGTEEELAPLFECEKREVVCVQGGTFAGTSKSVWYVMVKQEES